MPMAELARRLVVAGVTTRPLALSAVRAGWTVTAADAFGDLDLRACAEVLVPEADEGFDPAWAARMARGIPAEFAAYTSNFENYPAAVAALARGRRLLGNPPAVLRRVRDPLQLMRSLRRLGFPTPRTRATPPSSPEGRRRWLLKPRRSGGGHGTTPWRPGRAVGRRRYLQERIAGLPGSVAFLADGRRAHVLGVSRQLVGRSELGTRGFRYCGSLMGPGLFPEEAALWRSAESLAAAVVPTFGLVGLNGLDFIARAGVAWPIEANPRFSASMELLERGADLSLFALHAEACAGRLPEAAPDRLDRVHGKAIVFARRHLTTGATRRWLEDPAVADVPPPGQRIARGRPICTVFASGRDAEACSRALVDKAAAVYRAVEPAARGAA
jgi:predicted ATP-grasp superfamily ATP-dependent carboligase